MNTAVSTIEPFQYEDYINEEFEDFIQGLYNFYYYPVQDGFYPNTSNGIRSIIKAQKISKDRDKALRQMSRRVWNFSLENSSIRKALAIYFLEKTLNSEIKEDQFILGLKALLGIGIDPDIFLYPKRYTDDIIRKNIKSIMTSKETKRTRENSREISIHNIITGLNIYNDVFLNIAIKEINNFYNKQRLHKVYALDIHIKSFLKNPMPVEILESSDSEGSMGFSHRSPRRSRVARGKHKTNLKIKKSR